MTADHLPRSATLAERLSARALRTPEDRLWIDVAGGLAITAAAVWALPPAWPVIISAGTTWAMYGLWGVAERRLRTVTWPARPEHEVAWRTARSLTAFLGLAGFVFFLFSALGVGLGPIVS